GLVLDLLDAPGLGVDAGRAAQQRQELLGAGDREPGVLVEEVEEAGLFGQETSEHVTRSTTPVWHHRPAGATPGAGDSVASTASATRASAWSIRCSAGIDRSAAAAERWLDTNRTVASSASDRPAKNSPTYLTSASRVWLPRARRRGEVRR